MTTLLDYTLVVLLAATMLAAVAGATAFAVDLVCEGMDRPTPPLVTRLWRVAFGAAILTTVLFLAVLVVRTSVLD